jgi:hypothetical protein
MINSFCENPFASKSKKRVVRKTRIKGLVIPQRLLISPWIPAEKNQVMFWNVRVAGSIPVKRRNGPAASRLPSSFSR